LSASSWRALAHGYPEQRRHLADFKIFDVAICDLDFELAAKIDEIFGA
jgi:hypothetical protein